MIEFFINGINTVQPHYIADFTKVLRIGQYKNNIRMVFNNDKKAPLINLFSLPTKCSVCHSFQEPKPITFQLNVNDDAIVKFCSPKQRNKLTSVTAGEQKDYGAGVTA